MESIRDLDRIRETSEPDVLTGGGHHVLHLPLPLLLLEKPRPKPPELPPAARAPQWDDGPFYRSRR